MKNLFIVPILVQVLTTVGYVSASADDKIVFAYQISRHGASNGMPGQPDILAGQSQPWIMGELNKIGRR
jgi:uncharacterized Fe-S cluster protein YjdI